jgi:glycosyltransferase involved in cell wall biosynthesis
MISVLIPAFNEEENILKTIEGIKNSLNSLKEKFEIIVIDDGSKDKTSELAKKEKVKVIKLKKNYGKGKAINVGIKKAKGDIIVTLDADLGESSKDVYKIILPVLNNKTHLCIAKFKKKKGKGFGLVKKLSKWGVKKFGKVNVKFPLSGQRCFRREVYEKIGRFKNGFALETAFTIDTARYRFKIIEVDTNFSHRETSLNFKDFIHRGRQFKDISIMLIKHWLKGSKKSL